MDRSDSSRTPRLRTEVEGRIKAPQTRDINKDLTPKDQHKDKDLTPKDQHKDKDLLDLTPQGLGQGPDPKDQDKESLRTRARTRTTARQIILIGHINLSNVQW